jgi:hypothetical protein
MRRHSGDNIDLSPLYRDDSFPQARLSFVRVAGSPHTQFDKLGVWSRAQAIVFARDHGFSA